jgi:non-specific protein-tyrosine kinase
VREVKERYPDRYIIFDSPPLLGFSDALYLSRFADGVIIVVRSQVTKEEDLKRSLELLHDRHILGTVLNGVRSEFTEWRGYEKYYQ